MEIGTKQLYQVDNGRVTIYSAIIIKHDNPSILSLKPGNNCIGISETATEGPIKPSWLSHTRRSKKPAFHRLTPTPSLVF